MQINAKLKSPDIFLAKLIASRQRGLEGSGGGIKNCQVHHAPWLPYGCHDVVMVAFDIIRPMDLWELSDRIGEADSFVSRAEHPTAPAFPRNARPSGHVMRRVLDGMTWNAA